MKVFPTAAMDSSTKTFTIIFGCIMIAAILVLALWKEENYSIWFGASLLTAAVVSSYLLIPKIFVNQDIIRIKNTFVELKISSKNIKTIERFEKIGFNFRTFGVGGLFGYFGYFNGNDVWYVTNIRKKVKITMDTGKIYMISPENPDVFITEIQNNLLRNQPK